jgi:hypothetical protein
LTLLDNGKQGNNVFHPSHKKKKVAGHFADQQPFATSDQVFSQEAAAMSKI